MQQKSTHNSAEKYRRDQMKALYNKLFSLLPTRSSKEVISLSDQLEEAANYIRNLQQSLEVTRQKKDTLKVGKFPHFSSTLRSDDDSGETKLPRVEVHVNATTLDVVLITGFEHQFMFKEAVRILHEEGADVASASFSVVDQTVFHTLYCEIGESGLENEAAKIFERLKSFMADDK